ncbi:MAG: bifunctional (p)ppGpp synthetase/guanosine-3',5'-bis(diphosphate) 3'-pyrophosphohydrolase [Crocinitomicaceae bacterium]|jgi:GTP diphosphokinase / guanosine-3',5'-bis(diphosphate) 3'-diphosphatase|nr:bifunctional (p)ppGpp synthetase/guanosine-3',5'-bis(diphosphate) 3'-pyrophosphohydrolase [Crocinitomicaceae bacterium]MDP4760157.1 bifunctional (p)ppGpp synthetase/guanosine-3',5'-bis(diphosphate) 3'-pyrophosphohydrolase [Crocinitomicaceae bacterium]
MATFDTSNIDLEKERIEILNAFKGLLRAMKDRSREETKMVRKAFDMALEAHKDMRRKSGEPYIYHPIAVARICAEEMGLEPIAVACALLHDTVEDTYISLQDIEDIFGSKVRTIIDGLTKIPEVFDENTSIQAENFRKMILTISDDFRVVLIKLADRLHNMRTLSSMKVEKQLKIASETRFLYAPLAHRLGLYPIKTELEDLSMKYCEPEVFKEIDSKLKSTQDVRNRFIRRFVAPVKEELERQGYHFEIKARPKSIFSIWRKMQSKNVPFEEVFDLFALRIIVDTPYELEKSDCWRIYSIVTDFYQPSPDRLRDWISTPRANGYESLHTTVMSPQGRWVEVQIRSKRMDDIAEHGLAAHYKYKESKTDENKFDRWIAEIRDLLDSPDMNALDFVNDFKLNLFNDEIYVFTPKGELRVLPTGSTILDFAYDIHTEIGNRCIGAKVNNRLMPLSYQLLNGDQLEILTSKKQKPNDEWLRFVVSTRAKQKIKSSLNEERKQIAADGKEILERKFKQFNVRMNSENIQFLANHFHVSTITEFYFRIAKGKADLSKLRELEVVNGMLQSQRKIQSKKINNGKEEGTFEGINTDKDTIIIGEDFKGFEYQLAKCCNPIPGDKIFGFITISNGIKIHRFTCPNAVHLMSKLDYRCLKAKWEGEQLIERIAAIRIVGIDQLGMVNRLTEIISKQNHVNMKSISFETNDGVFEGRIKVLVYDTAQLEQLTRKFEEVEGVQRVTRWDSAEGEEIQ